MNDTADIFIKLLKTVARSKQMFMSTNKRSKENSNITNANKSFQNVKFQQSKLLIIWANEREKINNNNNKKFFFAHSQNVTNYFTFFYTTDIYFEK
jgi:hypothetical protein